jgi:hypothetical protein
MKVSGSWCSDEDMPVGEVKAMDGDEVVDVDEKADPLRG